MDGVSAYVAAFAVGLFGGAHCLGMCGGIMAALSFAVPAEARVRRLIILLSYNVGRIGSYAAIGFLVGLLGQQFSDGLSMTVLRIIAGGLLIAMGLYLADWWRGLTYLERAGQGLWRHLQPFSKALMPVKTAWSAVALGAIWGWLPCGLIYTALVYAMAQGSAPEAAAVMLAFGLGTLPTVLAGGLLAERLKQILQARRWRTLMALCIIGFGVWTLTIALSHAGHSGHSSHGQHQEHSVDHSAHNHSPSAHSAIDESNMDSHAGHKNPTDIPSDEDMPATHHKHHH